MRSPFSSLLLLCLTACGLVEGLDVDFTDPASIKSNAYTIVYDMLNTWYLGNQTGNNPGNLPQPPYYWWEAGAMFMHLVDYYYYTGDSSNNAAVIQGITWQAGETGVFMPANQTTDEGNDDQVFWAFAAMAAAELNFPPPTKGYPSWVGMAQAVFNTQFPRWDPSTCGGGLRWQFNPLSAGYTYKNMPANGGFFQLSARLLRYTGDTKYLTWAEKSWDWMANSVLIDQSDPSAWRVYDGASDQEDCQTPTESQYSYNYGILIAGLAYMYNHTEDAKWMTPLNAIVNGLLTIFAPHDDILIEAGCEPESNCNTDGLTFKSFTVRWLVIATQLVPSLSEQIWPYITASAKGAAGQCDGWTNGQFCGYHWTTTTWDGTEGVGQQMSALAVISAPLITLENLHAPLTLASGANSKSDPNAGQGDTSGDQLAKITTADRAGAGILTFLVLCATFAGTYWLIVIETP